MEEPASHSPQLRPLSSYHIRQTSQICQIKVLTNCLIFRSEFTMHDASIIAKEAAPLSLA
jgi:hypothetical protein